MSRLTSDIIVCTLASLSPGIIVKSTPAILYSDFLALKFGVFLFFFFLLFGNSSVFCLSNPSYRFFCSKMGNFNIRRSQF